MASNSCSFFTHSKLTCKVFMPSIVVLNLMVTVCLFSLAISAACDCWSSDKAPLSPTLTPGF